MNSSMDEDLPNVDIGVPVRVEKYTVTKINVDKEISQNLQRKELKKKILQQKIQFEDDTIELPQIAPTPKPKICSFPPSRPFINPERSLKCFNSDSLTTQNLSPSAYSTCTPENVQKLFLWIRSKLKRENADKKKSFFQYLWLLMSCHPDELVVQQCRDVLIEHNLSWQLKFEEVISIFYNWGVSPRDFVSDLDLTAINAFLDKSPLISSANVENVSDQTFCETFFLFYNAEQALHVLNSQLMVNNLNGDQDCTKSVFLLVTLLTLDEKFLCCMAEVHACLEHLARYAKIQNSLWVEEYCQALLLVESNHARVAFLLECVVPECMRWCLCLAHCQRVFSLKQTFQANPEPDLLQTILFDHFDHFMNLESWELYSLVSIVDAGISHVISYNTDKETKEGFLDWLNQYMERKIERRTPDIDIDATLIIQLISRLQAEWESAWLQEPYAPKTEAGGTEMMNLEQAQQNS